MKLAGWKRAVLAGLVTLSVVGMPLATFTAGPAAAGGGTICPEHPHGGPDPLCEGGGVKRN